MSYNIKKALAKILLHIISGMSKHMKTKNIIIIGVDSPNYQEYIMNLFADIGVNVIDVNIDKNGILRDYSLKVE